MQISRSIDKNFQSAFGGCSHAANSSHENNKSSQMVRHGTRCCCRRCGARKMKVVACCGCCWILAMACFMAPAAEAAAAAAPSGSESDPSTNINRRAWPPMRSYDIWSAVDAEDTASREEVTQQGNDFEFVSNSVDMGDDGVDALAWRNNTVRSDAPRQSKVIHLFPVPVDGECLSDDGRRTGTCFNAYECRQKGGMAKGECAMGFGVCCIFVANCNETVGNNITYLISPNFPSFMSSNFTSCSLKVKMMSADISQLRIDFYHFSLGQPNRRTGVCDGDVFNVSGGPAGVFSLCGQNSGQHIYYDVGGRALPRQTLYGTLRPITYDQLYPNRTGNDTGEQMIDITMNFAQRFLPIRLWEIRISQIPFSQRAPAGCLQYHSGTEGIMQTFNFADNGRHLANQHYRICMRQEADMCSIMYQPCDEQSFRIGPSMPFTTTVIDNIQMPGAPGGPGTSDTADTITAGDSGANGDGSSMPAADDPQILSSTTPLSTRTTTTTTTPTTTSTTPSTTTAATTTTTTSTTTSATVAMDAASSAAPEAGSDTNVTPSSASTEADAAPSSPSSPLNDDVEGSGDSDDFPVTPSTSAVSRRPRPVRGGFDLLGFLRSTFDLGFRRRRAARQSFNVERQFYSTCNDRITMPCIIEDFIGAGLGPLPGCEPVHCGSAFCSSGLWPCRIESTVTPFYIAVHFGNGLGKGSAEDNIGACLRYTQVQCI